MTDNLVERRLQQLEDNQKQLENNQNRIDQSLQSHEKECAVRWAKQEMWNKIILAAIPLSAIVGPKIAAYLPF